MTTINVYAESKVLVPTLVHRTDRSGRHWTILGITAGKNKETIINLWATADDIEPEALTITELHNFCLLAETRLREILHAYLAEKEKEE